MLRTICLAVSVLTATTIFIGCTGSSVQESSANATTSPSQTTVDLGSPNVVASLADPLYVGDYSSLEDLSRTYGDVIVGTVGDVLLPFDPRPGYKGLSVQQVIGSSPKSSWTPSPEEMSRPGGRDFTVYTLSVDTVIR